VTDVLPVMVLLGLGAGVAAPALMTLAMADATESDSGLASGLTDTTVQVGGALGLAVVALAVAALVLRSPRADRGPSSSIESSGREGGRLAPAPPRNRRVLEDLGSRL
jgi:hypothetical protein